ncbi:MAG: NADP-binding protein [Deltaproteobacteria bacterium]|nr:MAG: NADP-binding protein [Deltaproteobacteria bacterium]
MKQKVKIIQCGLGVVGQDMVKIILEKHNMELIGAIDIADEIIGKDLGHVIGLDRELGVTVSGNAEEVFRTVEADVVLLATSSYFKDMYNTARLALENGQNVITCGEEGAFPWTKSPELARKIDDLAKKNGVTFLGTGVTPGYVMDYLPISLTGLMKQVNKINIRGVANWAEVGPYDWELAGFGKRIEVFNEKLAKGEIGGLIILRELMEMTARALGWKIDEYKETKKALVSKSRREAKCGIVEPGTVCGLEQVARGFWKGKEVISYERAYVVNPTLEEDKMEVGMFISIEGIPGVEVALKGEVLSQGLILATAARVINSIPQVIDARPGLLTVYELPPSPCFP